MFYKSNLQMDLVVCEAREQYEKLRKEEQMTARTLVTTDILYVQVLIR